jgi:hypothetical protein
MMPLNNLNLIQSMTPASLAARLEFTAGPKRLRCQNDDAYRFQDDALPAARTKDKLSVCPFLPLLKRLMKRASMTMTVTARVTCCDV